MGLNPALLCQLMSDMPENPSWTGRLARRLARALARLYYSRIAVFGQEKISARGPLLLVANHANSLMDPVIIGIAAGRPVHFMAKAPLFQVPVFGRLLFALGMVPAFRAVDNVAEVGRNVESLSKAAAFLAKGEAVGIFPEGKSHDLLKIEQVRSGAARMALQAHQGGASALTVVPLGINYERKERFRSAIWVKVGEPIEVEKWLTENPGEARQQIRLLTAEIDKRLQQAVVHLREPDWEPLLGLLEAFHPPRRPTPLGRIQQRKRIADAMNYFWSGERERAEGLITGLRRYRDKVAGSGVTPRADVLQFQGIKLTARLTLEALFMGIGFMLVLAGTLHHLLPFLVVRGIARLMQAPGKSTVALARLGIGLPIYFGWYALVRWWMAGYFLPWVAWAWLVPMPLAGLLALKYWSRVRDTSGVWWRQIWLLLFRRTELRELRAEHAGVTRQLRGIAEDYARIHPHETVETTIFSWKRFVLRTLRTGAMGALLAAALIWGGWLLKPNPIPELMRMAPEIGSYSAATLEAALSSDERLLEQNIAGLIELEARTARLKAEFDSGKRSFYAQADDDAIRQLLFKYLTHRSALLNFIWKYQKHGDIRQERLRLRAFLTCFASACALHDASVRLVTHFDGAPTAIRKLNEPEPLWNIPAGVYDMVKANLIQTQTREFMSVWTGLYERETRLFEKHGLVDGVPYRTFHAAIARHSRSASQVKGILLQAGTTDRVKDVAGKGKGLAYRSQAFLSTWLGSTRVRAPRQGRPMISTEQLAEFRKHLKPGDILIERQNWYLSRAFMPGFWAHAAIYVGTTNDLAQLGLANDPRVRRHWREFGARDANGHEHLILEAVPDGVRMTTLEHCIGVADSAAALRPRISEAAVRDGIARAFSHVGKPYDFDFDFFSTDKLVCTELVCRAFDADVQFPLVTVMGRKTLPPTELVRKFVMERGRGDAQLDCVCFLDGDEKSGRASFKDTEVFATTINRPGLTWLQDAAAR
jgi:1-acyl-sn-glycerol-3-phosphate acyltransferase